jgi:hypothetical protein
MPNCGRASAQAARRKSPCIIENSNTKENLRRHGDALRDARAALAAAAPAAAQTGKPEPEADRTIIEADVIEAVSDLEISARGNAEIRRGDMTIFGETLRYNSELGWVECEGGVRLQRGADRFFGPRLYYNTLDDTGVFEPELPPRARPHGARQRRAPGVLGPSATASSMRIHTTCRPGQEDWRIEASELEFDFEEEDGAAVHPRLRFFDTTILAARTRVFDRRAAQERPAHAVLTRRPASAASRSNSVLLEHRARVRRHVHPVVMGKRGYQLKTEALSRTPIGEPEFDTA